MPTAPVAILTGILAAATFRNPGLKGRFPGLVIAMIPTLWLFFIDWRVQNALSRGPPFAQPNEIVVWHWNTTPLPTIARWQTSHRVLANDPLPNILIVTNPPPSRAWRTLHDAPPLPYRQRGGRFAVYADVPIVRLTAFSLNLPDMPGNSPPDHGAAMLVELDTTAILGEPIVLLAIDFPSDPRLVRYDLAVQALGTIREIHKEAARPWPEPSIILGDCNTPRHSAALRRLIGPHMTHAFDQGGFGFFATWPGGTPVLHIDHLWTAPTLRVRRYDTIPQPHYQHFPQAAIIGRAATPRKDRRPGKRPPSPQRTTRKTCPDHNMPSDNRILAPIRSARPRTASYRCWTMIRNFTIRAATVALVLPLVACNGLAQWTPGAPAPPPFTPPPGAPQSPQNEPLIESEITQQMLTLRTVDGRDIITPNSATFFEGFSGETETRSTNTHNGVDLTFTFRNNTSQSMPLGKIVIGGIRMGDRLDSFDFRRGLVEWTYDNNGRENHFPTAFTYPNDLYSPVKVLGNAHHWLGFSVLYPLHEYNHSVRLHMMTLSGPFARSGRNWTLQMTLMDELQPGESREYTVAIRLTPRDDSTQNAWLRTLTPYRDFFQATYGPVRYSRNTTPIRGITLAQNIQARDNNPFGYINNDLRSDLRGLKPTADYVRRFTSQGWTRVMIWTPSGVYQNHQNRNLPFQFLTPLAQRPASSRTLHELAALGEEIDMGLWWGRSQEITREWDTPDYERLDPRNPAHVAAARAELSLARQLNASTIGLDAYAYMTPRDAYNWLIQMQAENPGVLFVTEHSQADHLHTIAPTYIAAHNRFHPHVLADFLNPGHETWAGIRIDFVATRLGKPRINQQEILLELERVARLGLVPLCWFDLHPDSILTPALRRRLEARPSWEFSIPEDLQVSHAVDEPPHDPHTPPDRETIVLTLAPRPPAPPTPPAPAPSSPISPLPPAPPPPPTPLPLIPPSQREIALYPRQLFPAPRQVAVLPTSAPHPTVQTAEPAPSQDEAPTPPRVARLPATSVPFTTHNQMPATSQPRLMPLTKPYRIDQRGHIFHPSEIQQAIRRAQQARQGDATDN